MIITDILAAVPVAIKGIEILVAASAASVATRTLVRGDLRNRSSTIVASTWSARCELTGNQTAVGAAFVSLAIFAMATGVAPEFIGKAKVEQNKRAVLWRRTFSAEWDEHLWTRKYLCGDCACHMQPNTVIAAVGLIDQLLQQRKEANADFV